MTTIFRGLQMYAFLSGRSFYCLTCLSGVHLQSRPSSSSSPQTWSFWPFPPFLLVLVPKFWEDGVNKSPGSHPDFQGASSISEQRGDGCGRRPVCPRRCTRCLPAPSAASASPSCGSLATRGLAYGWRIFIFASYSTLYET